ncbi:hypothetical protein [Rhodococcus koreensis]
MLGALPPQRIAQLDEDSQPTRDLHCLFAGLGRDTDTQIAAVRQCCLGEGPVRVDPEGLDKRSGSSSMRCNRTYR